MSTVKVEVQLSSEELLKAVEQLSQADLERFVSQVIAPQAQRKASRLPQVESVMIPDFRLVHPDRRSYLLEINCWLLASRIFTKEVFSSAACRM